MNSIVWEFLKCFGVGSIALAALVGLGWLCQLWLPLLPAMLFVAVAVTLGLIIRA